MTAEIKQLSKQRQKEAVSASLGLCLALQSLLTLGLVCLVRLGARKWFEKTRGCGDVQLLLSAAADSAV